MTHHRRFGWLIAAVYAIVGLVVYAPALHVYFLADDYYFLDIVSSAHDVRVIFAPLIGRFVRPWIVLLYYVCHQVGAVPVVFHLAVLFLHVLNAWLVFLIALRLLSGDRRLGAFLAGLLFLVFSSHAEAVAWVAGAADPIVALCVLTAFLWFLRSRDANSSPLWLALSSLSVVAAALGKESWVAFPGLVVAYALCFPSAEPRIRRRTVVLAAASAALVAAYLAGRVFVFGSVTGGLAGLGTTIHSGHWLREIVKFAFRCFLPAGPWVMRLWFLAAIAALVTSVLLLLRLQGTTIRPLIFTAAATIITLAPVLPLSISIVNTESERFTYTATAFSSMLIVCAAQVIIRRRTAVTLACSLLIAWHAVVLFANTRRVYAAGVMARSLAASFAEETQRRDPHGGAAIFLMNLPDNLGGTYVFRSGFAIAVRLVAPAGNDAMTRTVIPVTHGLASEQDRVAVRRESSDTFVFDAAPNELIQREIAGGVRFRVLSYTRTEYRVQFRDHIRPTIVLFANAGRIEYAGTVERQTNPFGSVDLPSDSPHQVRVRSGGSDRTDLEPDS